ncbi:glycosyltransferase [Thioclava indica]|uniref:Glycosyltransferase subfamily 4-like N-terminal domain-containing protein n=1 Tax=Thioclava indica TaxID=1353528 RepID=A0A074JW96_9RHOB|nr:glycosyltransferase [Thioclava indica]KEO59878.1 hypothetical protein DT23_15555 [Thioclava indica]
MDRAPDPAVFYLAHDLDDTAIWRRVAMLKAGGAQVSVAGFRRGTNPLSHSAQVLGHTRDGRMLSRALSVARLLPAIGKKMARQTRSAPDVILARNLEMLVLAHVAARRFHPRPKVVYELLDIHRLMLGRGRVSRLLRRLEGALLRRSAAVVISSPGFLEHYLKPFNQPRIKTILIENKPFMPGQPSQKTHRAGPVAPGQVTIGWSGILRCARSLEILDALTRNAPGRYLVILRGKPALNAIPDFHATIAANPDLTYRGPYRWPEDLATIYADCDLAWLVDRYDAGENSDWLLPNRLYEGCLFGAVPIALAGTQVGARLRDLDCGLQIASARIADVEAVTGTLDDRRIMEERAKIIAQPTALWLASQSDCIALLDAMRSAPDPGAGPHGISSVTHLNERDL